MSSSIKLLLKGEAMKKRLVKAIGLMMSAVLVLGCTACGNSGGNAAAESGEAQEAERPADEAAEANTEEASEDGASGEKVTITLWSQFSDPNSTDGNYVAF